MGGEQNRETERSGESRGGEGGSHMALAPSPALGQAWARKSQNLELHLSVSHEGQESPMMAKNSEVISDWLSKYIRGSWMERYEDQHPFLTLWLIE